MFNKEIEKLKDILRSTELDMKEAQVLLDALNEVEKVIITRVRKT